MTDDTKASTSTLRADFEQLSRLADEVKVKVHLAGMEAKEYWQELEPRLEELEQRVVKDLGQEAREATRQVLDEVSGALDRLRQRLGR